ncbi:hypothetical protein MLD38_032262 [Melastoma candidum]|uniref:Uncharacterized protein n=1 Tax=Melastoma candidum TaxID=119954 RepID=A0ACB9M5J6_9MYRT|nr:hypothetical protein MLD38_032262 [Melastoma candidum]
MLVDGSYNAKISDFGLAKIGLSESQSYITTRGTFKLSDAFGFGVVLLEMLTALRALDQNWMDRREDIVDWLKPYLWDHKKRMRGFQATREVPFPDCLPARAARLRLTAYPPDGSSRRR